MVNWYIILYLGIPNALILSIYIGTCLIVLINNINVKCLLFNWMHQISIYWFSIVIISLGFIALKNIKECVYTLLYMTL